MDYDQITAAIEAASFTVLGSFNPGSDDLVPGRAGTAVLIGNAGPAMWHRFVAERAHPATTMDEWTETVLGELAGTLGGEIYFPFAKPPLPFLRWAQAAKAGFVSALGMNIHPTYGLWHAFRGALVMPERLELPAPAPTSNPCESCAGRPCLSACPVGAFSVDGYDVEACAAHISTPQGLSCLQFGCKARLACPVGSEYHYLPEQAHFHMSAFLKARP